MRHKSFLGIDIGTSGIKVVQLERFQRQPKLVTYGYAESHFDVVRDQSAELLTHVAGVLSQVLSQARVTSPMAVAALPTFAVFSSIITLPRMSKHDLATAIRWEAKKFIPLPIEEMSLDWKILDAANATLAERIFMMNLSSLMKKKDPAIKAAAADELEKAQEDAKSEEKEKAKNVRILLTAAPKTLVARYVEIFQLAKVKLLSLETEAFALTRALIGVEHASVMIVDIGSSSTNICLIEGGVPILNRGLDIGGLHITRSISSSLNVSFERAEQFKLDFGIRMQGGGESTIPNAIKDSLQPIINEIQYVFELYHNQGSVQIDRVVLAGGSAFLPNFPAYLSQLLKVPVYIGNPWDRVTIPVDLKPVLDNIGPQMAVSIGLAMRNIA